MLKQMIVRKLPRLMWGWGFIFLLFAVFVLVGPSYGLSQVWLGCVVFLLATLGVMWQLSAWQLEHYRKPDITYPKFPSYDWVLLWIVFHWLLVLAGLGLHTYELFTDGAWVKVSGWVAVALEAGYRSGLCA